MPSNESPGVGGGRARSGFGAFIEQAFSPRPEQDNGSFPVVRQGYDPAEVDATVRRLTDAAEAERQRADSSGEELGAARARIAELEQAAGPGTDTGFGSRLERLLRSAEQEAAEVRDAAHAEGNSVREQARVDAEAHRHQVEQDLLARANKMDEDATARTAKLNQRDNEIEEKLAAGTAEIERLRAAAERDAENERAKASQQAHELTEQAERAAQRTRESAQQEADELAQVRDGVRGEMAELHRLLGSHLTAAATATGSGGSGSDGSGSDGSEPVSDRSGSDDEPASTPQ